MVTVNPQAATGFDSLTTNKFLSLIEQIEADKRFAKEAQERAASKRWLDRVYSDIPDYK